MSALYDPVGRCPYCEKTSGVRMIHDTPPKVEAWSCADCGTDWAVTVMTLQVRPLPDELAVDVVARSVLAESPPWRSRWTPSPMGSYKPDCSAAGPD